MVKGPGRLAAAVEWMDLPGTDAGELGRALRHLARVNRLFGGTRTVLTHLTPLLRVCPAPIRILDVATGYADIPRAILRRTRRLGLQLEIEALDHQDRIVELAARASRGYPEIRIRSGDALSLDYPDESFDVILASQVLHHMEGDEPVRLLSELYRVARRAVLVSDLRRGRWPLLVTWTALRVVSRSRLIRHDGPMSIRRGFLAEELLALAREAGWGRAAVSRHAFFRLVLVGEKS
ncbi:MAG TPA: methyltransferase domain-containing protein [Candidatus Methylomirabilis sp.]|nr:methyltransferase domain-containing protein [Candidatus Methylomirabilis sp.]